MNSVVFLSLLTVGAVCAIVGVSLLMDRIARLAHQPWNIKTASRVAAYLLCLPIGIFVATEDGSAVSGALTFLGGVALVYCASTAGDRATAYRRRFLLSLAVFWCACLTAYGMLVGFDSFNQPLLLWYTTPLVLALVAYQLVTWTLRAKVS